jgi:hypothetical protein
MDAVRSQPLFTEVTLGKLIRDVANVRRYARFVLVLTQEGVQVIDNGHLRKSGLPYAKLIAVVGTVSYKAETFEGLLMEIGYSRTRPYTSLEERHETAGKGRAPRRWHLKARSRVRGLTDTELASIYPHFGPCMETIVLEHREKWQVKKAWWVNGPGPVERGVYFTVSRSDARMHQQMALEDVRFRKRAYISGHMKRIRRYLRRATLAYYPLERLRTRVWANLIADVLAQRHYTPFYRTVLIQQFPKGSHQRSLLGDIAEAFAIDVTLSDDEVAVLHAPEVVLPHFTNVRCYRVPQQPVVHARGASVFEVILTRSYREKHEVPF